MSQGFELGPRLRALAARVLPDRPMADLCCDHAQLAASLVRSGRVPRAIGGDVAAAPLAAAAEFLAQQGLDDGRVELRCGDGFGVLRAQDAVATVVIAGIGAPLCERLLSEGRGQLASVERLVVQANHGFPKLGSLRAHIVGLGLGFGLVDECVSRERGRVYVTLVAERGGLTLEDVADRELGPLLRRGQDPLWGAWLEHERRRITRAVAGMERSKAVSEEAKARADARDMQAELAQHRAFLRLLDAHAGATL